MGTLAQKLARCREMKGLSQQALAERANVTQSSISRIETGLLKNPGVICLQRLATALDVSLLDLLETKLQTQRQEKGNDECGGKY